MSSQTLPIATTGDVVDRNIKRRLFRDGLFRHVMTFGGLSVIIAISLIFVYLASVVVPLFTGADMTAPRALPAPATVAAPLAMGSDELREVGVRYTSDGRAEFFSMLTGQALREDRLPVTAGTTVVTLGQADPSQRVKALGLSDGTMVVFRQDYRVTFPGDKRLITPEIDFPLGEQPIVVDERGSPLRLLSVQVEAEMLAAAALTQDGRLLVLGVEGTKNPITGEVKAERASSVLPAVEGAVRQIVLEINRRQLYVAHGERFISQFDVTDKAQPRLMSRIEALRAPEKVSQIAVLSSGYSVIVGGDRGSLEQWFGVRNAENVPVLTRIRDFKSMPAPITALAPEHFRKGFAVGDEQGNVGLYYATSRRLLLIEPVAKTAIAQLEFTPRANGLLIVDRPGQAYTTNIHNEYPEVSFHSLWQKVWYEGYQGPEYLWQSSAAVSDFEPKLSLAPLTFGTLKAAFYAMLVAVPLAILGAIYTAYFMSAGMRKVVKPSIEIMEALPTVILGFLAGLWLAPLADRNLPAVILCFALIPLFILLASGAWRALPQALTMRVAPGWEAGFLIPVVLAAIWVAFQLGHPIEVAFFGGDMPNWLSNELGITYEQRNSLVVGIAMGFAVTPTIFSIAEDAIFQVPRHLSSGSLALGATPWQTLTGVVLLTASPGIFSALMIGLGRAVGETMIVLMATGNTAVMDLSIFTGFRTLSANIGVEMPEAAVGSTHYRLLFLSALVLFVFTFVVNTAAELVRQRLREKYSSI